MFFVFFKIDFFGSFPFPVFFVFFLCFYRCFLTYLHCFDNLKKQLFFVSFRCVFADFDLLISKKRNYTNLLIGKIGVDFSETLILKMTDLPVKTTPGAPGLARSPTSPTKT